MGKTQIEWTDYSWNPWIGCIKVSPGCQNCYMYRDQKRYGGDPREIRITKPATFNAPLKWARTDPGLVFTSSWTDFFLEEVDPQVRTEAWEIMWSTPHNTYQILTKRPENILDMLPKHWGVGWPNVWLGVSVENQEMADLRIPTLLATPARVRFLSCEPLLGPIDLTRIPFPHGFVEIHGGELPGVDWVIVGGESGPDARPMEPEWGIDIKDQCGENGVAFFMKQMGGWPNTRHRLEDMPIDLQLREFPRTL